MTVRIGRGAPRHHIATLSQPPGNLRASIRTNATAEADSRGYPSHGPASRAAGRSIEIVRACEVPTVMTTSSPTRSSVRGTAARHALGRRVRANLSTAELYEDAIRAGEGLVAAEGPTFVRNISDCGSGAESRPNQTDSTQRKEGLT